jgi:hypothetical protein
MAGLTGTLGLADLLLQTFVSAEAFGLDTIQEVLTRDVEAHNTIIRESITPVVEITTDAQRIFGGSTQNKMQEVNEFGRAPTQRAPLQGSVVGFPLKKVQYNLGWTREWFRRNTPADMAQATRNAEIGHRLQIEKQFRAAIFGSANYTYYDIYNKGIALAVKRFLNADGSPIPAGPNAEVFDGTVHTHYLANATLTAAFLTSVVNTVTEHNATARVQLTFAAADESAVRALTGFNALIDTRYLLNVASNQPVERLNWQPMNNVQIGWFGRAEVWLRTWGIQGYVAALDINAPGSPVVMREYALGESNLRTVAQFDMFPLHAEFMEAEFGMAVWYRSAGAVGYFAGAAYTDPVIT